MFMSCREGTHSKTIPISIKIESTIRALKTHRQIDNSWNKFLVARDRGMPLIDATFEAIIFSVLRLLGVQMPSPHYRGKK